MKKYQAKCDSNYWNLDALQFLYKPNAEGSIALQTIRDDFGPVRCVALLNNQYLGLNNLILALRPDTRILQSILTPTLKQPSVHHEWKNDEDLIDMAVHAGNLFVLMKRQGKQLIAQYKVLLRGLIPLKEWSIDDHPVTSSSRIKVTSNGDMTVAYIGPVYDTRFLSIDLRKPEIKILKVLIPGSKQPLGRGWGFCVDAHKGTLIIADTEHHRIIEADSTNGIGRVICGTGRAGNAHDREIAIRAPLNSPLAVALYRPTKVIRQGLLSVQSITFLTSDPGQAIPRTILIADAGNFRVKKLVELPFIACQTLSIPDDPFVYTLIGSGADAGPSPPKLSREHKADLRSYPIPAPTGLCVSPFGELLVCCDSNQFLIFLRPATTVSEEAVAAARENTDYTDE